VSSREGGKTRTRLLLAAAAAVAIAAAVAAAAVLLARDDDDNGGRPAAPERSAAGLDADALPAPVQPAFRPKPVPLGSARVWRWAPVRGGMPVRRAPRASAPVVARVSARTPEGTQNIVLVLGRARDEAGGVWTRIRVPALPTNVTGWVPRSGLGGYGDVRTHLVVDLGRFTATLFRNGRPVFRAEVGVGKAPWPTPRGEFYVRNKLTQFRSPFYGPIAFGTSARSPRLTDWPAGGFVGIHGTNRPDLLPGRVSHGCIRLRNRDILRLSRLMPVGTPLTIV
jgi:lipoprotein-anchoring transpeptidase ErfK/SrfK